MIIDNLQGQLASLLVTVDDNDDLCEQVEECLDLANLLEIVEVRCSRCDRLFCSLSGVRYCSEACKNGGVKMPFQTREDQAEYLVRAAKGLV